MWDPAPMARPSRSIWRINWAKTGWLRSAAGHNRLRPVLKVKHRVAFHLSLVGLLAGVIVALLTITQGRLRPVPSAPSPQPPPVVTPQTAQSEREDALAVSDP